MGTTPEKLIAGKITPEAQALLELGKKLNHRQTAVSGECPKTQLNRIDQAIATIATHKTLSIEQKERGIAALERAQLRMRLRS